MSVRHQLLFGFGTLLSIMLLTGIVSVATLQITAGTQSRIAHDLAGGITALERLRIHAERLVSANRGYLLTENPQTLQRFKQETQLFRRALDDLESLLRGDPAARPLLARVDAASTEYLAAAERGIARRETLRTGEELVTYVDDTLQPARRDLDASLDRLRAARWSASEAALAKSRRTASRSGGIVAGTTLLAFALSIGLALTFSRRFSRLFEAERRAVESARRASAAREEILSIVSHDLRNPLAAILLGASGLRRAAEKGEVPNRWIDSISSAGERMKHLIETILASSSIDAGTLTITPRSQLVRVLLDEAFGMFERSAAAKEIRLSRQVPEDLQVEADPDRLLQVLSNLIGNALKFTPRSGTVSIGAERENDGVRFFVEDTGPGIADDQLARLFERHWQAHRGAHAGLGLGLYIAKEIVALHGGRIWAETKLGSGTSFFFTIPTQPHRQSGEPADQRIAASAAESSDGDHERRPTA